MRALRIPGLLANTMSEKAIVSALDERLLPLGFTRRKTAWNRRSGCIVDGIDMQVSKAGDTATVNAVCSTRTFT